jgi:hypothetical protein
VAAARAARLFEHVHEARHDLRAGRWAFCSCCPIANARAHAGSWTAPALVVAGQSFSVLLHHHRVRRHFRLSRAHRQRHDAENDHARNYARPIGYGAMCLESLVAIMALIAACTLEPGVYLSMNVKGDPAATVAKVNALNFPVTVDQMNSLAQSARRKNAVRPHRRRGDAGRRHGAHFFQGRQRPLARSLVSLRHHVRGAVHPDDARRRHARGALFIARFAGQPLETAGRHEKSRANPVASG